MINTETTCAADIKGAATPLPPLTDPSRTGEINRRIANSLQLLSALVSVHARAMEDPLALAALDEKQGSRPPLFPLSAAGSFYP